MMKEMKGGAGRPCKKWVIINCLSGLSTRIMVRCIQKIEIEADVIRICVEKEWTVIRRYNRDTIEARLQETEKDWRNIYSMNDRYFGEGTEARQVKEAQENERRYLEGLRGIRQLGMSWKPISKKALSREISWLKDPDFDDLKQRLESLSDKFALNVEGKRNWFAMESFPRSSETAP